MMNELRLRHILQAYGGDERRWPVDDRQAALELLTRNPALAAEREAARQLDDLLAEVTVPAPSPELLAGILAAAPAPPPEPFEASFFAMLWPFGRPWQPAMALALSALFGILVGLHSPPPPFNTGDSGRMMAQLSVENEMEQLFLATDFDPGALP